MAEVPVVYDVPEAARQSGLRRPAVLRPILTTQEQARRLYRVYKPLVDLWAGRGRERIMDEYTRTLASFTGDSPADIAAAIEEVEDGALDLLLFMREDYQQWAQTMEAWHVRQLAQRLTYATNVTLGTQMLGGAGGTVEDYLERNMALIRDVSDQTRGRISDIVFRGVQQRTPARDIAREIANATGMARARALRIASDQTVKFSSALDELRGQQLGFPGYEWQHSHKLRFRPEHLARDGDFIRFGSEIDKTDPPGFAPFCGCKRRLSTGPAAEYQETDAQRNDRLATEAREYVLENGRREQREFLSAFDQQTGQVLGRTSGERSFVGFTPELERAISDPQRRISVRHNHPSSNSFSRQDIYMLGEHPGMAELWADAHDGTAYRAVRGRRKPTRARVDKANRDVVRALQQEGARGQIDNAGANAIWSHTLMLVLNKRRYIEYTADAAGSKAETYAKYQALMDRIVRNASAD